MSTPIVTAKTVDIESGAVVGTATMIVVESQPPPQPTRTVYATAAPTKTTSGKAVASLICAIIGIFFFGVILGPIAVCLALSARRDMHERPNEVSGECMATSGLVVGIIATVLSVVIIVLFVGSEDSA